MKDLYKGRYLIAVYDKDENCIGVFKSIKELKKLSSTYKIFYSSFNSKYFCLFHKYYLIDCLEQHDDIFSEEDKEFLKECPDIITNNVKANKLGISLRSYYRKKSIFNEIEEEIEI